MPILSILLDQDLGQCRQFCPLTLFQFREPSARGFRSLYRINEIACCLLCLRQGRTDSTRHVYFCQMGMRQTSDPPSELISPRSGQRCTDTHLEFQ